MGLRPEGTPENFRRRNTQHAFAIDRSLMCVFDDENPYEIHTNLVAGFIARRM